MLVLGSAGNDPHMRLCRSSIGEASFLSTVLFEPRLGQLAELRIAIDGDEVASHLFGC